MTVDLKYINIAIFRAVERTRKLVSLIIITSRMQASGERRHVLHKRPADLYAKSLSLLRLRVARLYLYCGISHLADFPFRQLWH